MITLLTGLPGHGKTLYCVDKLLRPLVDATIKHEVDGQTVEIRRRILTNINGLLLDHVKIDAEWLMDWHNRCQPGDVIVYDEVQKAWPLVATGSKVPPAIEALETHRHMGVDFIPITQHPMLIHANLTRLVGRHLHVRRLGNMGFATVYEWDGCSRTLLYKNTMAKYPYRYNAKVFDLYKSAEVHTKQPRKMPSLVFGIIAAIGGMAYLGPTVAARLSERMNPQPVAEKPATAPKSAAVSPSGATLPAPVASAPTQPAMSYLTPAGCISSPTRCACFDAAGMMMPAVPEDQCRVGAYRPGYLIAVTSQPPASRIEGKKTAEPAPSPNGE